MYARAKGFARKVPEGKMNIGIAKVYRGGSDSVEYLVSPNAGAARDFPEAYASVRDAVSKMPGFRFLADTHGTGDSEMNIMGDLGEGDELLGLASSNRICQRCYGSLAGKFDNGALQFHGEIGYGGGESDATNYRTAYNPNYYS